MAVTATGGPSTPAPTPVPLIQADETDVAIVKKYAIPGPKQREELRDEYFQKQPKASTQLTIHMVKKGALGSVLGAAIGGAIGSLVNPLAAKIGIAAGMIAGAAVFSSKEKQVQVVRLERSEAFQRWKAEAQAKNVYVIFQKYINENVPEDLQCRIGYELCQVPVRDPHGCLFERDKAILSFEKAHKDAAGKCLCPGGRGPLTSANELVFDPSYHPQVMNVLMKKLGEGIKDPTLIQGAKQYQKAIIEDRAIIVRNVKDDKIKDFFQGKCSKKEVLEDLAQTLDQLSLDRKDTPTGD